MTAPVFEPWPKIARLNRPIVITEKLDGTNAAILIVEQPFGGGEFPDYNRIAIIVNDDTRLEETGLPDFEYHVYAQSRNKFITPGKSTDNYGFAGWVEKNAEALVEALGEGRHFGEWWGAGIQSGYGLSGGDKRFSLFNTARWGHPAAREELREAVSALGVVPVLYDGPFDEVIIDNAVALLRLCGSFVADFPKPEGIVVYHTAARTSFKITLEGDESPKNLPRRAHDELPAITTDERVVFMPAGAAA